MDSLTNIFWLALKEFRSVLSDKVLVRVRALRLHLDDLPAGNRYVERGQQCLDRLRGRGPVCAIEGTVQCILSTPFPVPREDLEPTKSSEPWTKDASCSSS